MNDILYVLRISHKKSETDIAKLLGIPVSLYKKMESGELDITLDQAKILGAHFNVDASFFPLKKHGIVNHNIGASYTLVMNPTNFYAQPTKEQLADNQK